MRKDREKLLKKAGFEFVPKINALKVTPEKKKKQTKSSERNHVVMLKQPETVSFIDLSLLKAAEYNRVGVEASRYLKSLIEGGFREAVVPLILLSFGVHIDRIRADKDAHLLIKALNDYYLAIFYRDTKIENQITTNTAAWSFDRLKNPVHFEIISRVLGIKYPFDDGSSIYDHILSLPSGMDVVESFFRITREYAVKHINYDEPDRNYINMAVFLNAYVDSFYEQNKALLTDEAIAREYKRDPIVKYGLALSVLVDPRVYMPNKNITDHMILRYMQRGGLPGFNRTYQWNVAFEMENEKELEG